MRNFWRAMITSLAVLISFFWVMEGSLAVKPLKAQGGHPSHADHLEVPSPLKKDRPVGLREIKLSPYAEKIAEIQTAPVERKFVTADIRMVGKVEYDETRLATITARVAGRLDRLYVDFTGTVVRKGDPLVYLYSPDLFVTQRELLRAVRASQNVTKGSRGIVEDSTRAMVHSARERLRLWGLTAQQIDQIVKTGNATEHITITAPISGVVIQKDGLEGMYVEMGTRIYTIADLSRVWIRMDAYESDLVWIHEGQEVEFQVEAYPGEIFKGTVAFIDPFLRETTRTVKVRLNAPNPEGKLKPEMFVHAVFRATLSKEGKAISAPTAKDQPPLVIPASAPLITGKRAVVYVAVPNRLGTYEGREIVLGPRAGDYFTVRHGLREGEWVVTHGNFKIDSAVQIQAKPSMMTPEGGGVAGMEHAHGEPMAGMESPMAGAPMEIPDTFKEHLRPVMDAHQRISDAVRSGNLLLVRKEFSSLGHALRKVDMTILSGHAHMVWMEMTMLLENDAVMGSDVQTLRAAKRAHEMLTQHMQRLSTQFVLDRTEPVVHAEHSSSHADSH